MLKIVENPITQDALIEYWTQYHPVGTITVAMTGDSICYLGFGDCLADIRNRFPKAALRETKRTIDIDEAESLRVNGTSFQISVWRELLKIKSGSTRSYSDIATAIGHSKAVRAVGSAVGRNPISILIPCHRVLRADGSIGGYYWGEAIKKRLLAQEQQ